MLPYSGRLILVSLLFLSSFQGFSQGKVVHQDVMLFKVREMAYSYQDVLGRAKAMRELSCIMESLTLTDFLEMKNLSVFKSLPQRASSQKVLESETLQELIKKILIVEKLVVYAQSSHPNIDQQTQRDLLKLAKMNSCPSLKEKKKLPEDFIELVRAESLLKSRFSASLRSGNRDKLATGLKVFKRSLVRQIPHELFW